MTEFFSLILSYEVTTRAELFKAGLRKPRVSARFEFRFERLKSISVLILFVYKLMIESSKYNSKNYPRKCFWTQERETWVKFNPGLSANWPSNNWAQNIVVISLYKRPFAILETKRKLGQVNFCKDFWDCY